MSTISDKLKESKEIFFLVELDFDGLIKRYSTKKTISVSNPSGDDKIFEGTINSISDIGASFSFTGPKYSIATVNITLINKERMQDQEVTRRLDGGLGTIWIWCEGLTWDDIDKEGKMFKGTFRKTSHDKFNYSFQLIHQVKDKFEVLPRNIIDTDTWPNHRTEGGAGSVAGKAQPLLLGNWSKGVPLLCVDTAAFKYIVMQGVSKSVDADYTATTVNAYDKDGAVVAAAGYTFYPGSVDGQGNIIAYFDFAGDQAASEPLSCSIEALTDSSGDITGTAGTLIEHPSDINYYIMDNFSGVSKDDIDVGSLRTMKSVLPGLKFSTIVNNKAEGSSIINRLLSQCYCALTSFSGKVSVMTFNFIDPISTIQLEDKTDVVGNPKFSKTPIELVTNDLLVNYKFNPSTTKYESKEVKNKNNNYDCKRSSFEYGVRPQIVLNFPDVQDDSTATFLAYRFIKARSFRHDIITFEVPYWIGWDTVEGDAGELTLEDGPSFDGNGWTDEKCILLERKFKKKTIHQKWWRISTK